MVCKAEHSHVSMYVIHNVTAILNCRLLKKVLNRSKGKVKIIY